MASRTRRPGPATGAADIPGAVADGASDASPVAQEPGGTSAPTPSPENIT